MRGIDEAPILKKDRDIVSVLADELVGLGNFLNLCTHISVHAIGIVMESFPIM